MPKPMFYLLAMFGPWEHHVKLKNNYTSMEQAENWLAASGKKHEIDYEIMNWSFNDESIVIFMDDPKLATFIKLTWG